MPVLPFHRYIGPGNRTDNGEPVDEDDHIAKQHDIKYDTAKSEEDVRRADLEAIIQFRRNWLEGNWHSLIGDFGLSLKYFVETYTGVLYPDVPEIYVNENEVCRVIVVNNLLKLHCVSKRKPFLEKYKINPFLSNEEKIKLTKIPKFFMLTNNNVGNLLPVFLYMPPNWSEIYIRSQLNPIFQEIFVKHVNRKLTMKNVSKDSLKVITKYLQWKYFLDNFFINRRSNDKEVNITDKTDYNILTLFHSGYVFIDHDGNLLLENMY